MGQTANIPVLTIDGPSGSGKGTIGQVLAQKLGWHFLDSGALYRSLGFAVWRQGIDLADKVTLMRVAGELNIHFVLKKDGSSVAVMLNGEDVGDELRTEEGGRRASQLAAIPEVRQALLQKQHDFRQPPGLVADGRDMGTTVFPDAILKIYLTATPEVRAQRRYKQLKEKGFDANLRQLLDEIRERDTRDAGRKASPLKPAEDACILDTSLLDITGVVEQIYRLLLERR